MQYTVVISEEPGGQWRAAAPLLPDCAALAPTREQVLEQIKAKLIAAAPRFEIVQIEVPANVAQNGQQGSWAVRIMDVESLPGGTARQANDQCHD